MLRRTIVSLFAVLLLCSMMRGQQTAPSSATSQEILEVLAEPTPADTVKEPLPKLFSRWTERQKNTISHQVAAGCVATWGIMNGGGRVHLLPSELDSLTTRLVLAVCVTGKMPADWTGRQAMLADATEIMDRSTNLGLELHLPPSLVE